MTSSTRSGVATFAARACRRRISARLRPPTPTGSNDWSSASAFSAVSSGHGTASDDLLERHAQAAVGVHVADQESARLAHVRRRVRDAELLGEVGLEAGRRLGPVLERELLGLLAHAGRRRRALHVVAEVRLELEVGERVVRGAGRRVDDRLRGGDVGRRRGQRLGGLGAGVGVRRRGGELAVVGDGGLEGRVRRLGRGREIQLAGLGGARLLVGRRAVRRILLVEDRVRDELLVHDVLELQARHLQQLDRLLQRRRHDETLRESQREFLFESHLKPAAPSPGPTLARF